MSDRESEQRLPLPMNLNGETCDVDLGARVRELPVPIDKLLT